MKIPVRVYDYEESTEYAIAHYIKNTSTNHDVGLVLIALVSTYTTPKKMKWITSDQLDTNRYRKVWK